MHISPQEKSNFQRRTCHTKSPRSKQSGTIQRKLDHSIYGTSLGGLNLNLRNQSNTGQSFNAQNDAHLEEIRLAADAGEF